MRIFAAVVVALLIGLLVGGLGPRGDVRKANARIADLEKQLKAKSKERRPVAGVAEMLNIPVQQPAAQLPPEERRRPFMMGRDFQGADTNAPPHRERRWGPPTGTPEDRARFRDGIRTAMDAWRVRSDLARNSFVSNVATNDKQTADFDVLMAAMNLRLSNSISQWATAMNTTSNSLSAETGLRMMNGLSQIVVTTYDELDRLMPSDWRENAGPDFAVFDFIDPAVALPLAEMQGGAQDAAE